MKNKIKMSKILRLFKNKYNLFLMIKSIKLIKMILYRN